MADNTETLSRKPLIRKVDWLSWVLPAIFMVMLGATYGLSEFYDIGLFRMQRPKGWTNAPLMLRFSLFSVLVFVCIAPIAMIISPLIQLIVGNASFGKRLVLATATCLLWAGAGAILVFLLPAVMDGFSDGDWIEVLMQQ